MTVLSSLHLFSMVLGLALAVFITGRDSRSWTNLWCAALFICFSIWNGGMIFKHSPLTPYTLQPMLSNINAAGWIFSPMVALSFVLAFTEREWIFKKMWFWALFIGVPGLLLYKHYTGHIVADHVLKSYGWLGVYYVNFWTCTFLIYLIICIAILLILNYSYITKCDSQAKKSQARIIFISLLLSAIPITANTLAGMFFGALSFPEMESIFMLIFCCGIVVAMSRHKLMNLTPMLAVKNIISNMPSGMLLLDKEGALVSANEQARSMLGWPSGEMVGRHIRDFLNKDQTTNQLQEDILRGDNFRNREMSLLTREGLPLAVSLSRSLLKDDAGEVAGIVCLATDLTLTRAKEVQLRESEEKYRDLVENINEVVYSLSPEGTIIYVNPRVRTLMGYHPEDLLGRNFSEFIHPEDFDELNGRFLDVMAGYAWAHEFRVKDKTGEFRWVYSSSRPARRDDSIVGVQGTLMDVTERKKNEEEKFRLETELRRSQKMEAIGTLAGGIAHNFNNILYPIMGYAEMVLEDLPEESPFREELEEILTATHRAKELVKQILAFSRVTKEAFQPQAPWPIVEDAIAFIRNALPATIRIKTHMDKQLGYVIGDRAQIYQMLMNLCTNAYQAMSSTGGVLELRLERCLPSSENTQSGRPSLNEPHIKFSVIDTGEGMTREVMDRIFDPYFTTKPVGEGTGMGLAVTHAMVEKHGGFIQVFSKPGKGSRFDILLPASSSQEPPIPVIPPSEEKPHGNGERVLLVDDEKAVREVTRRALERLGYAVTVADNGLSAWEEFQKNPQYFDLVLTDLTMPGLTGRVLANRIFETRPNLPIVLISGFSESEVDEAEKSPGVWARVMKPLEQEQMAKVVRRALDQAKSS
ncbi:MAG: PAS domain S-box protein [Desulfatibacillum sp.]|nr:PAS domain S-box protein [Desulfatibacillum sp.]